MTKSRWSDLRVRVASALVLVPLALLGLWLGGVVWDLMVLAFIVGLAREWLTLTWGRRHEMPRLAWFGVIYVLLPGVALLWLRARRPFGLDDSFFLLIVIWSTDIGAYLVGRFVGGRRLAPSISPGKTWSGALGGLLCGILAGMILAAWVGPAGVGGYVGAAWAGFWLSVVAQIGDLFESWIKRRLGVKDSGQTIPGHGGLFDRLDGLLAAAPVAALIALFAQIGMPLWL
ncbi:MAG: hypothetical protein B7Z78_12630 [Rhodospirillales bacterium 20-60-12]|nr:MAG: hypothetical protein B7Z78_12630 [Rhodospirillales bacterium 20-60-12]HQT68437.1 CDP-archaeol synthase [Acetobacteraceae bacterium]